MERFNPWWKKEPDQAYEDWSNSSVRWFPEEIRSVSLKGSSLNFLSGPRQVGKTTAIKLLIAELLSSRPPESIFYYSCDELYDHKELGEVLDGYLTSSSARGTKRRVLFLDEVTFVRDWWRAVKSRIDDGSLRGDALTVTGSASLELMEQRERFPGRRGEGQDITMRPRAFSQYVAALRGPRITAAKSLREAESAMASNKLYQEGLSRLFQGYLQTGGFPRSIIEMSQRGRVSEASVKPLIDWLRADWAKTGRNDRSMKEIIAYLLMARGTPVSWLSMARETSIRSPHTTEAYVETLEALLVVLVLELITPQGKVMHRKNRKIHFADPLVYRALGEFAGVQPDEAAVVEGTVASHLCRRWKTHYWRNGAEVDAVALDHGEQVGVETKWGFGSGRRPRHLPRFLLLNKPDVPLFLSSLTP